MPRLEPTALVLDYCQEKYTEDERGERHSRHSWSQKIGIPKGKWS